jgi:hypothetical protein
MGLFSFPRCRWLRLELATYRGSNKMGERNQVIIREDAAQTVIYTHHDGEHLADLVADVLSTSEKLDSPGHVAAQIIAALIPKNYSGYGLTVGSELIDVDYPSIWLRPDEVIGWRVAQGNDEAALQWESLKSFLAERLAVASS